MASEGQGSGPAGSQRGGRQPVEPAMRKRLQKCFEHAQKQISQGNFKYASELLTQCVLGDLGNKLYLTNFIDSLQKLYNNNRKGATLANFKELGARSAFKKANAEGNADEALKNGFKILAVNPWDASILRSMAAASRIAGDFDCELAYLKFALEANPKDPETNKQCGRALSERGQFDQAIACWHRVEQILPEDEEAKKAISELNIRKNAVRGGFDTLKERPATQKAAAAAKEQKELDDQAKVQEMWDRIAQRPKDLPAYFELSQFFINADKLTDAEDVLNKALTASNGDSEVREKLEDVQIRRLRSAAMLARQKRGQSEEAEQQWQRLRKELHEKELEVCVHRVERYPTNLRFKYDLGLRYQIGRNYAEAIKQFQQARNDPRVKGACMLGLGQCFQSIKQTHLARHHYEEAIAEIPDRDVEQKSQALYLAGKLAMDELQDLDLAEKYLTALAGMDFTYKDVSALLDKIAQLRQNNGSGENQPG